jgi:hypothetical protein
MGVGELEKRFLRSGMKARKAPEDARPERQGQSRTPLIEKDSRCGQAQRSPVAP